MPPVNSNILSLTSEQLEMLTMSEDDIANGRIISEEELDRLDEAYFKSKGDFSN
ncbi:hypothetical protein [Flavobacterium suzhouense]|uniref:Uncharacterized protein n=1 Tax=Flavobacterium suzhouense TaxID=1529638 RepID=A0ABW5NU90_9FLAO